MVLGVGAVSYERGTPVAISHPFETLSHEIHFFRLIFGSCVETNAALIYPGPRSQTRVSEDATPCRTAGVSLHGVVVLQSRVG